VNSTRSLSDVLWKRAVCVIWPDFTRTEHRGKSVAKHKKSEAPVSSTRTQHPAAEGTSRVRKTPAPSAVIESAVTLNRRAASDRRTASDRRKTSQPVAVERRNLQRRVKVSRRRQIDPTTCERDYTVEEIEFMAALDAYKRSSGRMFPTCSEILEVIRNLGYEKRPPSPPTPSPTQEPAATPGIPELPQPVLAR
jgi:hypothetical protein